LRRTEENNKRNHMLRKRGGAPAQSLAGILSALMKENAGVPFSLSRLFRTREELEKVPAAPHPNATAN
jgi:hypothetical protein